jgi:CubicO group peptidase (beta-lactamase class C family)
MIIVRMEIRSPVLFVAVVGSQQIRRRGLKLTAASVILIAAIGASMISTASAAAPTGLEAKVDAYIEPFLRIKAFSGSILVARGGEILLSKGYGMANYELEVPNGPGTKFHIASISKTFTAAAIKILAERGVLKVEDPLSKYVPDYPNGGKITIHNLLVHNSGIPNINNFREYDEWSRLPQTTASLLEKLKGRPLRFEPGARYEYSNSNYNILAYIIEKTASKSYGDFVREAIFEPLGMRDTAHDGSAAALIKNAASGYVPAGYDGLEKSPYLDWTIKTGNGSITSTVEDLYKWDRGLYSEKVLSKASIEKIFTPYVDGAVGYGWFISRRLNRRCFRMNGRSPGFQGEIHRFIDDDACVIVLSNNYSGAASFMIDDIDRIAFGEPYEMFVVNPGLKIDPGTMTSFLGLYKGGPDFFIPNGVLTVLETGGHLAMRWSAGGLSWLVPMTGSQFYDRNYGGRITFIKDANGAISHLIYRSMGTDYKAVKTPMEGGTS